MANLTNVDAGKLQSAAQKLEDIDREIVSCVRKLHEAISTLDRGWKSEVKTQFMKNWEHDADALCEMMEQYEEVQRLILEAARDFDNTEQEMLSQVRQLR